MILGTGFESRYAFRFALIGMILILCLCDFSWSECVQGLTASNGTCFSTSGSSCSWWPTACGATACNQTPHGSIFDADYPYIAGACFSSNARGCDNKPSGDPCYESSGQCYTRSYVITTACSTQAEADSVECVNGGDTWSNGSCQGPIDSSACDSYRSECESIGGKFTGNVVSSDVSSTGCLSFCDMCNSTAQNNYRRALANICCSQGKSPPSEITSCVNNELTGDPDMSFSNFDCDNQGGFDCDCQDVSSENSQTFNSVCNEDQWEEPNDSGEGSGDGESSSSSDDGSGSSGSGEGEDWEYDYRDSLHKIIDYDKQTLETNKAILTCLTNPSFCGSGGSSTDYSGSLSDIKTDIKNLDTTVNRSITTLKGSISVGNDSLIDSIRKFISMNSFSFSGDTLGDSLGKIHGTLEQIKGIINGNGSSPDLSQDYGGFGSAELDGMNLADSVRGAIGFDGLDSINIDGRFRAGLDSANSGSFEVDSVNFQNYHDSLGIALVNQVKNDRDHLPDTLDKYADSLIAVAPFSMFDSLIYSTLGSRIPNTDQCPDDCFSWSLDLPRFGLINYTVNYGVCLGRVPLGGMNALSFIRLIVRLFVVVSCIWIVVWNFTRKKG